MDYSKIMKFKGTWRSYQARVLARAKKYIEDGKIHIVAAPGSGKTTLGIELIGRIGEPALVLTPSITIREQWVSRIEEGFLNEGVDPSDYLSQDLKDPRVITVVTYQALHSAMTRYKGQLTAGEAEGSEQTDDVGEEEKRASTAEEVDYASFDLIGTLGECKVRTLCLDECHHLRAEWWKALEEFKRAAGEMKVIALTATPPYDSTPAFWKRYMDMCGEIDEEITIPELVKEGSLCPHQDYVYFNYPTAEESAEVERFKVKSREIYERLLGDAAFEAAVSTHGSLHGDDEAWSALIEDREYMAAFLAYLQEKKLAVPDGMRQLAKGVSGGMNVEAMERLLQGFIYTDSGYHCEEYRDRLEEELKTLKIIDKRKVSLAASASVEKLLTTSKGKCKSIADIVSHEFESMGEQLRLLVLTDYIRKEYERLVGDPDSDVTALGVLPFFEQLRRQMPKELRLGVLCGTIVIIPAGAKTALEAAIGDEQVHFSAVGSLPESEYLKVSPVGDAHFLTGAVTKIFAQGYMQALIGTKSLLGEGWDSPCINSLILASFVGSFMLSNQMRGRAIRVYKDEPQKTSNIWHLVCLPPESADQPADGAALCEDFALLARRMEHFLGLHYTQERIENGIARLSVISAPFHQQHVAQMNEQMLALSAQRSGLKERWMRALTVSGSMEVVDEIEVGAECAPAATFVRAKKGVLSSAAVTAALAVLGAATMSTALGVLCAVLACISGVRTLAKLPRVLSSNSAEKRLGLFADGIHRALCRMNALEEPSSRAAAEEQDGGFAVYLEGGSSRDKQLFSQCVKEALGAVDSQRYVLQERSAERAYYGVPEICGRRKEDAQIFYECIRPVTGECELIYTRSETGRKVLMDARVKTAANAGKVSLPKKRVKVR